VLATALTIDQTVYLRRCQKVLRQVAHRRRVVLACAPGSARAEAMAVAHSHAHPVVADCHAGRFADAAGHLAGCDDELRTLGLRYRVSPALLDPPVDAHATGAH